ncbi:sporulation protein [Bacillus gobiensis]|uniref:sporulation protein n=1 Tax=Bacillus gobiensis TaxID=1441095 RepID=UPI003D2122E3
MLKKFLSSVGIGSARVDTKLLKTEFEPGEEVEGTVEVQGGSTEQNIDDIYLSVFSTYTRETNDKKYEDTIELFRHKLLDPFVISPNETKNVSFRFVLPYDVPITKGKTKVWIQTGLDIKNAIDPKDRDYIQILPHPLVNAFLQSAQTLGFRIHKVDCEEAPRYLRQRTPFVQEFEFTPASGRYRGRLDELEAIFFVSQYQVEVILQVDRKGGFLFEALEMDENIVRFTYGPNDVSTLTDKLSDVIDRYS